MKKSELKQLIKEIVQEVSIPQPSEEVKMFAKDISNKMSDRMRKKGQTGYNDIEAVRQMIESKMTKEGWVKQSSSTATTEPYKKHPLLKHLQKKQKTMPKDRGSMSHGPYGEYGPMSNY